MQFLPDGSYDVIVVDAETSDDGHLHIELTITMGRYVGHIIPLRERNIDSDSPVSNAEPFDLLGLPGTLRVRAGVPTFRPERV